jgi:hypothetical protein
VSDKPSDQALAQIASTVQGKSGTNWQQNILVGLFLIVLFTYSAQIITYGLTDSGEAFQSPWCKIAPANYQPIITYLDQHNVKAAWATNLLGNPIPFLTDGKIIVADPEVLNNNEANGTINRIPAYLTIVEKANRPALLAFVAHDDAHPTLLQMLNKQGVHSIFQRFPSQLGADVLVVLPQNQTVSFTATPALFDNFWCSM